MAERLSPKDAAQLMVLQNIHVVAEHVADAPDEDAGRAAFAAVMVAMTKEMPSGAGIGVEYAPNGAAALVIRMPMPPDEARKWEIALACEQAVAAMGG